MNGAVHTFTDPKSPNTGREVSLQIIVDKQGVVTFGETTLKRNEMATVKWGLKSGTWHTLTSATVSPNHWEKPQGPKHTFFLLEGCVSDEPTRPFLNEFLTPELLKNRKTTEVLAAKIEVQPAEGAELSGLGFSETVRNHFFVEVEGSFKRQLKVLV